MKYIDAERLRKEVKRLGRAARKFALGCADSERRKFFEGKDFAYLYVGILIDSLQQEQPEVDLEKEIHEKAIQLHTAPTYEELEKFARHFYELGLKARRRNNDTRTIQ